MTTIDNKGNKIVTRLEMPLPIHTQLLLFIKMAEAHLRNFKKTQKKTWNYNFPVEDRLNVLLGSIEGFVFLLEHYEEDVDVFALGAFVVEVIHIIRYRFKTSNYN